MGTRDPYGRSAAAPSSGRRSRLLPLLGLSDSVVSCKLHTKLMKKARGSPRPA